MFDTGFSRESRSSLGPLAASYATVSNTEILRAVSTLYDVGPIESCHLFRRGFNDTYEIGTSDHTRFFARLQAPRARGIPNTAWETSFLRHLKAEGVGVAAPIQAISGGFWHSVETASGPRALVLFEHAVGEPPGNDLSDIALMGRELAGIHKAGASFSGADSRYRLDIDHLLGRPLASLLAVPTMSGELSEQFSAIAAALRVRFETVAGGLKEVLCHGDCHGGNTFVADGESRRTARFFDFDDGGPGYQSYDIAVFLWSMALRNKSGKPNAEQKRKFASFIGGYLESNEISGKDIAAIPVFVSIRHFWLLGEYADRLPEWGTGVLPRGYLSKQVDLLKRWTSLRIPIIAKH